MPIIEDIRYFEVDSSKRFRPPLILIHGAGSDHSIWPHRLRRLPGWRVIAIDLPGHGGSLGAVPASIQEYARRVWKFLIQIKIYHAILLGHSLGGMIALEMALSEPERVASLILLGASRYPPRQPELCARLERPADRDRMLQILEKNLFSPDCDPKLKKRIMLSLAPARLSVLCADWKLALEYLVPENLHEISCPALILSGEHDRMTPPASGRALAGIIPHARFECIPKAGHSLFLEQTELVTLKIQDFLQETEPKK